jgi:hypothetical protein
VIRMEDQGDQVGQERIGRTVPEDGILDRVL